MIPVQKIPGTELYTGIYYAISLKKYPKGYITWVGTKTDGTYNIVTDNNYASNRKSYAPGKHAEVHVLWVIAPTETAGQYQLINKKKFEGYLTYSSKEVGSGYHAAILTTQVDKEKMSEGGPWHAAASWKFHVDKTDVNYVKLENVQKKGYYLTWSNYKNDPGTPFIQLANYDAGNDAIFLFKPRSIKLNARVYDFEFKTDPDDVFKKKGKQTNVAHLNFNNPSAASIEQSVTKTIEAKESYSYTFKQSLSVMSTTKLEASFIKVVSVSSMLSVTGSVESSKTRSIENTEKTEVKTTVKIPPYSSVVATFYNVLANNVALPFDAKMSVVAVAQRVIADTPSETQDGEIPGSIIQEYVKNRGGKNWKIIEHTDSGILVKVSGELAGNFALQSTVIVKDAKSGKVLPTAPVQHIPVTTPAPK